MDITSQCGIEMYPCVFSISYVLAICEMCLFHERFSFWAFGLGKIVFVAGEEGRLFIL